VTVPQNWHFCLSLDLLKKKLDTFLRTKYHIGMQKATNAQRLMPAPQFACPQKKPKTKAWSDGSIWKPQK
jgi:hypothetical protein